MPVVPITPSLWQSGGDRKGRLQPAVLNEKTLPFDHATLVARTNAGDAELITPTHGLALGQRRLLSQLESPRGFDELVAEHALDAAKTERDLMKLAQRGLVMVQVPSPMPGVALPSAVALGGGGRRRLSWPLLVGGIALALAVYKFVASPPPPIDKPDTSGVAPQSAAPARTPLATTDNGRSTDVAFKRN